MLCPVLNMKRLAPFRDIPGVFCSSKPYLTGWDPSWYQQFTGAKQPTDGHKIWPLRNTHVLQALVLPVHYQQTSQ